MTPTIEQLRKDKWIKRFAENLSAAYIAAHQGIGMDYARKAYVRAPGDFWYIAAHQITEAMDALHRETFSEPAERGKSVQ